MFRNPQAVQARRLLVVEDEPILRHQFARLLGAEGRVDVAADGIEALARLDGCPYDLILTEVSMPRLDGLELFDEVVATHPEMAGRFMFMAGALSDESAQFFRSEGLWPLLRKPITADALVSAVRERLAEAPGAQHSTHHPPVPAS